MRIRKPESELTPTERIARLEKVVTELLKARIIPAEERVEDLHKKVAALNLQVIKISCAGSARSAKV